MMNDELTERLVRAFELFAASHAIRTSAERGELRPSTSKNFGKLLEQFLPDEYD